MALGSKRISRLQGRNKVQQAKRASVATRAIGYVRVSTEEQALRGFGLEAQERSIRAFAESQGYELVDVIADPGIIGASRPSDRPGFRRVLELAEARAVTVLLVYKIDRLARDMRHAVTTVSDLVEQHEVAFRSVTESAIDTSTPMGRTIFAIFAGMAENERHTITERTKGGRIQKATKGGFAGGRAPYGYEVYEPEPKVRALRIVEDEAKVVRRIWRMRSREKLTLQAIADTLNGEGIPSPRGGQWRPGTVDYVIDNPKYRGDVAYLFRMGDDLTVVGGKGTHDAILAA